VGRAIEQANGSDSAMCNLYSLTKGQAAIREWFRAGHDRTGNLPVLPGIFPDRMAPIVRTGADGERELVMVRWGMPGPPPQYGGQPVRTSATLIRLAESPVFSWATTAAFLFDRILQLPRSRQIANLYLTGRLSPSFRRRRHDRRCVANPIRRMRAGVTRREGQPGAAARRRGLRAVAAVKVG
jgi:hypothetical protein